MIGTYAPTGRARRILIAVLAFALVAAVAFATAIAPAGADSENSDVKAYSATIGVAFGSTPAAGTDFKVGNAATFDARITFENVSETGTQPAGSFSVEFKGSDGFSNVLATDGDITVHASGKSWRVDDVDGNTVIIVARTDDDRIDVGEKVSVDVTADAPAFNSNGNTYLLPSQGDQQIGGIFGGGNEFTNATPDQPTVTVGEGQIANCVNTQSQCKTGDEFAGNGASSSAECTDCQISKPDGIGTLTVQADDDFCTIGGGDCSASWVADSETDSDWYLIITIASEDLGGKVNILSDQFDSDGELIDNSFGAVRNCQPPKRIYGCVDIKHDAYSKKLGIYPIRYPGGDPRGGYR